jgi:hypothetical protein
MAWHRLEPFARRLHPDETASLVAAGQHCDVRACHAPPEVYAWCYPNALGGDIGAERQLCTPHGEGFAHRQGLAIEPAPAASDLPARAPAAGPGAYITGMSASQIQLHKEHGWTCDYPACRQPARYLSSLRYRRAGRILHRTRFLCDPHAWRFAAAHGLDLAMVGLPGGGEGP